MNVYQMSNAMARSAALSEMAAKFRKQVAPSLRSSQYVASRSVGSRLQSKKDVRKINSEEHQMDTSLFDWLLEAFAQERKYSQALHDKGAIKSFQQYVKSSKLNMQAFQQAFAKAAEDGSLLEQLVDVYLKGLASQHLY